MLYDTTEERLDERWKLPISQQVVISVSELFPKTVPEFVALFRQHVENADTCRGASRTFLCNLSCFTIQQTVFT